jgi:hypothetical protein
MRFLSLELRYRTMHALQAITADMLHRVWDQFDYRVDVCRGPKVQTLKDCN